jgi:hypothetical protein
MCTADEHLRDEAAFDHRRRREASTTNSVRLPSTDLPWNPQRIRQRIGRCHRYGQKHDVVVQLPEWATRPTVASTSCLSKIQPFTGVLALG